MPDFSDKAVRKAELRAQLLAARRSLPAPVLASAAAGVRGTAAELVRRMSTAAGLTVAGYVPMPGEPGGTDLPDALADALGPGGRLLLPVLCDDLDLDWAAWRPGAPLAPAGRGMREPGGPRLGPAAVAAAGLVLVPALAVDRRGTRLGRGGGSYDRALARVPAAVPVVALLHDGELLDAVPAEPHDRPVDAVITPTTGLLPLDGKAADGALLALG